MRFQALHKFVTYLIAGLGLYALTLGTEIGLPSRALLLVGFVVSVFAGPGLWSRSGYTTMWNALVLMLLGLQVVRGFLGTAMLELGLEFAAFLQIAKLFHRATAKDHQHVQALAFLHLIAATVLTTGLDYGFAFFGFVLVTPWMFALTHLRAEIERHYTPHLHDPPKKKPAATAEATATPDAPVSDFGSGAVSGEEKVTRILASRKVAGWRFLAGTAALSVPLFFATAAFFLLFPRVGMGFLAFGENAGRRVAGFGSNVQLGGFGTIRNDPTVVLRVQPQDLALNPPVDANFRLRGTSFDRYEDAEWTRTPLPPTGLVPHGRYAVIQRPPMARGETRYDIHLDPLQEPVVFLLPGTIALRVPPRVESGVDIERRLDLYDGLDLRYEPDGLAFRYTIVTADDAREIGEVLTAPERERYLQLPLGLGRVRQLGREIAGEGSASIRARRIERWLRDSGEIAYSLTQPETEGRNPLDVFLFEAREGHCEYFSTALAVMLRGEGIPARNVTGFLGGRYNSYGRYYAIAQGDAHSWVEAWVNDQWETFDPTPGARGEPVPPGMFDDLRAMLDALRTRWNEDVVGYDLHQQVRALRRAFRWLRSFQSEDESQRTLTDEDAEADGSDSPRYAVVAIVCGVLLLLGCLWMLWRRRKRRPKEQDLVRLYRQLERVLERAGHKRGASTTPREHARALREAGFQDAQTVDEVTELYLAARWGDVEVDLAALRQRVKTIRTRPTT